MHTVGAIADYLDQFAPSSLAADWDNVGLLLGDRSTSVQRVMTCLTVTPEVAREAIESKVQLIVTHHPILFRAIQRLTTDTPEGRMLLSLIQAGVAVFSPHTAFDSTTAGINQRFATAIGLQQIAVLKPLADDPQALPVKLVFPLIACFLPGIFLSTLGPVLYQMIQVADSVLRAPR